MLCYDNHFEVVNHLEFKFSKMPNVQFIAARATSSVLIRPPASNVIIRKQDAEVTVQEKLNTNVFTQRLIAIRSIPIRPVFIPVNLPVFVVNTNFNVFNDRSTVNMFWYLPEYQFTFPSENFFNICSQNSFDSKNNELFKCTLNIGFSEVIMPDRQQYFDSLKSLPNFSLNKIPVNLSSASLVISYEKNAKSINIAGKLMGDGMAVFEFEDNEDFSTVQLAYRNVADPNSEGNFAQVFLYGEFDAFTVIPGIVTSNNNFVRQNMPYTSNIVKISVPCNTQNGTLYNLKKGNTVSVVGCLPPWTAEAAGGNIFREINTSFNYLRVFQSCIQPEFFYVIPAQYYIDRDDTNNFRPSVDIIAMLNPDEGNESQKENIIVLNFYVKPALNSYSITKLEQLLLTFCPTTADGKLFPVLKFPGNLNFKLSPSNLFDADADEGSLYSASERGYNLRFILSDPLDLAKAGSLIPATLKSPAGYIRKITFSLDEKLNVDSTITLCFHNTTGNVLTCLLDKVNKNVVINNNSPLTINISKLIFYNSNKPGFIDGILATPLVLNSNQQAAIPFEQAGIRDDGIISQSSLFSDVEADYIIQENVDDNLTESRICASYLKQSIAISTNINPVIHNLQKIVVNARIMIVNIGQLLITMFPENGVFSDHPEFDITLPLNDDLAKPENKVMDYTVQFYFNDDTMKETGDQQINFGTNPLIFISPDIIPV